jgi:P-type Cu+ transporter
MEGGPRPPSMPQPYDPAYVSADGLPIDPVCGMQVDPASDLRADYDGHTYYFCNPSCLTRFTADPKDVLHPAPPATKAPADAIYTCPMHPQIRERGPGACPICGMALEPETATLDDAPNAELIDMTRRFRFSALFGLPIVAFAMAEMIAPSTSGSLTGFSSRSRRRSSCGRDGRSTSARGRRS